MKIVIISAHPDDLETGIAGTAHLLKQAGHEVISVVGMLPTREISYADRGFGKQLAAEVRMEECRKASKKLSIKPIFLNFAEMGWELTNEMREYFKKLMSEIAPDVVFSHWSVDVNPDHRALGALTLEAFMQKGMNTELFCYEVFSEVGRPQSLGFIPTHYVDIAGGPEDVKKKMVYCHNSQGIKGLWAGCMEMQRTRGVEHGIDHAEAFIRLTRCGKIHPELRKIFRRTEHRLPHSTGVLADPKKLGIALDKVS